MTSTGSATLRTDRVRFVALLYPKEGVTFEEFDRYWTELELEERQAYELLAKRRVRTLLCLP